MTLTGKAALAAPCWRKSQKCTLHWRTWGGDSVVFEERSGHTHQFAPLAAAVMACFEQKACSIDGLAAVIAADLDTTVDDELLFALAAIVEQFCALNWIEAPEPT